MAWLPWIQALAPVVGGAIDRSNNNAIAERNRKASATRIQTTVKDAKAAGINPLTAIGAGAANTTYQQPQQVGSSFGSSLSQAADALASAQPDPIAKQTALEQLNQMKANNKLTELEIQIKQQELLNLRKSQNVPRTNPNKTPDGYTIGWRNPNDYSVGSDVPSNGGLESPPPVVIAGHEIKHSPWWSPTQNVSEIWGDGPITDIGYALPKFLADMEHHFGYKLDQRANRIHKNMRLGPRRRPTNTRNRYPLGQPTKIGRWNTFQ